MSSRKGLLMRVGIDQAYGSYNAPINPITNDYLYMPIPSKDDFRSGMRTSYNDLSPHFESWCQKNDVEKKFPEHLKNKCTHLDPDFDYSTYGDQDTGRGLRVGNLQKDDFIAFYASFKPISKCNHELIYALYGIMVVDKVLKVEDVVESDFHKNAHTRLNDMNKNHWVVFANPALSGRFNRAILIGEWRDRAYRVTNEILDTWGGIDIKDGYIQRSVNPPWFNQPEQFLTWLSKQQVKLINSNWTEAK